MLLQECEKLDERWAAKCGCRMPVKGEASMYTIEIVKYKEGDRGEHAGDLGTPSQVQAALATALA